MIGTSVSLCFREMARGIVNPHDVEKIISGTKAKTPEQWEHVIQSYRREYWQGVEDVAEKLLRQFIQEGKIIQPRLSSYTYPNRDAKLWVAKEDEIVWY